MHQERVTVALTDSSGLRKVVRARERQSKERKGRGEERERRPGESLHVSAVKG